jgi:hypothetical protein
MSSDASTNNIFHLRLDLDGLFHVHLAKANVLPIAALVEEG